MTQVDGVAGSDDARSSTENGCAADYLTELRLVPARLAAELAVAYGIPHPAQAIARGVGEAAEQAETIGYPIALKSLGPTVVHKSDVGGVHLGLRTAAEVRRAAGVLLECVPGTTELLVQVMAEPGLVEMIVGAKRDPVFGPVVMVGLGGRLAETVDDVAIRLVPVSPGDAHGMVGSLRGAGILRGARGEPGVDFARLVGVITAVSELITDQRHLHEIDLNPVICDVDRVEAVDLRLIEGPAAPEPGPVVDRSASVEALLRPSDVVVIGASRNPAKQGGRLLRYLLKHGYRGQITVIHPTASEVMGCRALPDLDALETVPELACIAVASDVVPEMLESCGKAGIKAAVVFGSGFAETGDPDDVERQQRLLEVGRRHGIAVCGPNTAGVASTPSHLCASMGAAFEVGDGDLPTGSTALVSQSGAIGGALLSRLRQTGLGFSHWIAAGNEADLTLGDYLAWLANDPDTRTILLFVEAIRDVAAFRAACGAARANGKRVIAYKTGRSSVGQAAVRSHTAALAGDDAVYRAAFRELGVVQVDTLQALIDAAVTLDWQPAPRGRRVGVVSGSGGACSVVADECERVGLELPPLSPGTRERVAAAIPVFGRAENPVDVTMQINVNPVMAGEVTQALLDDDAIDAVLVMMTSNADPMAIDVARGVIAAANSSSKPVVVARMGAEELAPRSLELYKEARVPVFPMPDRALTSLAVAYRCTGRTEFGPGELPISDPAPGRQEES